MKTYEKIGLMIGAAALGFAAYQTYIQKEAVNKKPVMDTARSVIVGGENMISGAVETGKNFVGGLVKRGSDGANEVKNKVYSGASGLYQAGANSVNFVTDTGQNGLKYIWNTGADTGNALRETGGWFFTKGKDAMGNTYEAARTYIPNALTSLGGLTGIYRATKHEKPIGKPTPPSKNKTEDWIQSYTNPRKMWAHG